MLAIATDCGGSSLLHSSVLPYFRDGRPRAVEVAAGSQPCPGYPPSTNDASCTPDGRAIEHRQHDQMQPPLSPDMLLLKAPSRDETVQMRQGTKVASASQDASHPCHHLVATASLSREIIGKGSHEANEDMLKSFPSFAQLGWEGLPIGCQVEREGGSFAAMCFPDLHKQFQCNDAVFSQPVICSYAANTLYPNRPRQISMWTYLVDLNSSSILYLQ